MVNIDEVFQLLGFVTYQHFLAEQKSKELESELANKTHTINCRDNEIVLLRARNKELLEDNELANREAEKLRKAS